MTERLTLADLGLTVEVRRSARARRLTLSVDRIGGEARLTAPPGAPVSELRMFLRRQADWLSKTQARATSVIPATFGARLPYLGGWLTLRADPDRGRGAALISGEDLMIPGHAPGAAALAFFKHQARAALTEAARRHAGTLGRPIARITLRDPCTRWGSCTTRGALSFSWRLIMAPQDVLDYVAAHEAAHLVEMNHSDRFWAVVERLRPDWRAQRDWLKREGTAFHRYRFTEG